MVWKIPLIALFIPLLWAKGVEGQKVRAYNKAEFAPTAFHKTIYEMMEECSGIDGDFERLRWYIAKLILVGDPDRGLVWNGMWTNGGGTKDPEITLDREKVFDGEAVSHETLHDLYEGTAPMDVASRCVLNWDRLRGVFREEKG